MKNMKSNSILAVGFLLFMLVFSYPPSIEAQEVENQSGFDYLRGSTMGPDRWGAMRNEWSLCSNGTMQSPIDMSSRRVEMVLHPKNLYKNYKPCNATMVNRGHDIMVKWIGDAGSVIINDTEYALKQAHWHSPSEHTINGKRFDMELHMVHLSIDNKIAVIAVLYNIGRPSNFLSRLAVNISSMIDQKGMRGHSGIVNPREIQMSSRLYYRYIGSLTVPPCTEKVVWTISRRVTINTFAITYMKIFLYTNLLFMFIQVRTVSIRQVRLLREAVKDYAEHNARPVQPDNLRDILLYAQARERK
ncbi:putative carbonic anhydrase [Helianthus annuus]|nr:putative carbonic anhydrase [Helianthus annuus]KAJ0687273.1 putative carbonic anhydrase [Helianthus annuus]KAJ0691067.1 putative carbonic anhydrase [Helianthus annuus]